MQKFVNLFNIKSEFAISKNNFNNFIRNNFDLSFSSEDEYMRTVCKNIKQKIDEENNVKFKFNRPKGT